MFKKPLNKLKKEKSTKDLEEELSEDLKERIKFLDEGNFKEYIDSKLKEKKDEDISKKYPFGPINRTDNEVIFEELIYEIILDFERKKEDKKVSFFKENKNGTIQTFISIYGHYISLPEVFEKIELSTIKVPKSYLNIYEKKITENYIEKNSSVKSLRENIDKEINTIKNEKETNKNYEKHKSKLESLEALKKADNAEILAIHLYTKYPEYLKIKEIIIGKEIKTKEDENVSLKLKDIEEEEIACRLATIAILSQGINNVQIMNIPEVSRMVDYHPYLEKAIKEIGWVSRIETPCSTSYKPSKDLPFPFYNKKTQLLFRNVRKGVYPGPLSNFEKEEEFLIAPHTEVTYLGSETIKKRKVLIFNGSSGKLNKEPKSDITFKKKI